MRCFIAMPLPDELRENLAESLATADKPRNIRRVNENRWHLTIAFLDEIDSKDIPSIIQRLKRFNRRPGNITIRSLETFPSHHPRLLIAGGNANPHRGWRTFADRVRKEVAPYAPNIDTKPWKPHITLGRTGKNEDLPSWHKPIGPWTWDPDGFSLVKSDLDSIAREGYEYLHDFFFKN